MEETGTEMTSQCPPQQQMSSRQADPETSPVGSTFQLSAAAAVKDTNVESDTTSQCPPQGAIPPPQRPSILERLSNEILSKVFLISRNLYLLDTCHKIKDALTIDVLLNELVLLPFSRSGICERHKVYINNLEDFGRGHRSQWRHPMTLKIRWHCKKIQNMVCMESLPLVERKFQMA